MPRVYSEDMFGEIPEDRWDDEDFNPFEVPPEAFQYLPAPEFGGPDGVVRVDVGTAGRMRPRPAPGLFDIVRPKKPVTQDEWQAKVDRFAATLAQEFVKLGAAKAYVRYDGGNDEGFSWFDHCIMQDGSTRNVDELARDLEAAGFTRPTDFYTGGALRDFLEEIIGDTWSWRLLGSGWGAGPIVLFGGFFVDLKTGVVTDDVNAAPVVRNIQFGAG
jgi:hypothetical protein